MPWVASTLFPGLSNRALHTGLYPMLSGWPYAGFEPIGRSVGGVLVVLIFFLESVCMGFIPVHALCHAESSRMTLSGMMLIITTLGFNSFYTEPLCCIFAQIAIDFFFFLSGLQRVICSPCHLDSCRQPSLLLIGYVAFFIQSLLGKIK